MAVEKHTESMIKQFNLLIEQQEAELELLKKKYTLKRKQVKNLKQSLADIDQLDLDIGETNEKSK